MVQNTKKILGILGVLGVGENSFWIRRQLFQLLPILVHRGRFLNGMKTLKAPKHDFWQIWGVLGRLGQNSLDSQKPFSI